MHPHSIFHQDLKCASAKYWLDEICLWAINCNSYPKANPKAHQKGRRSLNFMSFLATGLIGGFRWTSNTATAVDFAVVKNKRPCSVEGPAHAEHTNFIVSSGSLWQSWDWNAQHAKQMYGLAPRPTRIVAKLLSHRNRWRVPTNLLLKWRSIQAMLTLGCVILAFGLALPLITLHSHNTHSLH